MGRNKRDDTTGRWAAAKELWMDGASPLTIATALGITQAAVIAASKQLGWPRRQRVTRYEVIKEETV